jgi:hypothetical protein
MAVTADLDTRLLRRTGTHLDARRRSTSSVTAMVLGADNDT